MYAAQIGDIIMQIQASVRSGPRPPTTPHRFAATAVIAFAAVALAAAFFADRIAVRTAGDSVVLRCDRLSAMVGRNLAERGIAADSADWRRQKQLAFRACLDDPSAFEKLISAQ
jgi:hypothetical protein